MTEASPASRMKFRSESTKFFLRHLGQKSLIPYSLFSVLGFALAIRESAVVRRAHQDLPCHTLFRGRHQRGVMQSVGDVHSRGVVRPSSPSSLAPTTGIKCRGSNMPALRREREAINKSAESWETFALDTIG